MRLIDADELEKVMTEDWFLENLAVQDSKSAIKKDIVNMIDSVPLAYDVDAVVAELEEHKTQYGKLQLSHNDANMVCVYVGKEQAIDCAIETVKAGGK